MRGQFTRSETRASGLQAAVKQLSTTQRTTSGVQVVNGSYVGTSAFCQAWGPTIKAVSAGVSKEVALGAEAGGTCRLPEKWLSTLVLEAWAISLVPAVRLIQGNLRIYGQHALQSLSFLAQLEVVTGDVVVEFNDLLESISLAKLAKIGGSLIIKANKKLQLTKVDLPKLADVGQDVRVESNDVLESITLPGLANVGADFVVLTNKKLTKLDVPTLAHVAKDLRVESNDVLESLSGLPELAKIGSLIKPGTRDGSLVIKTNKKLAKVDLPKLADVIHVHVESNDVLESITLPKLAKISRVLRIRFNTKLSKITFPSLQHAYITSVDTAWFAPKLFFPGAKWDKYNKGRAKACDTTYKGVCLRFSEITSDEISYFGFPGHKDAADNVPVGCQPYQPVTSWTAGDMGRICTLMKAHPPGHSSGHFHMGCGGHGAQSSLGGRCSNRKAVLTFSARSTPVIWVHAKAFAWNPYNPYYDNTGGKRGQCQFATDGSTVAVYACKQ